MSVLQLSDMIGLIQKSTSAASTAEQVSKKIAGQTDISLATVDFCVRTGVTTYTAPTFDAPTQFNDAISAINAYVVTNWHMSYSNGATDVHDILFNAGVIDSSNNFVLDQNGHINVSGLTVAVIDNEGTVKTSPDDSTLLATLTADISAVNGSITSSTSWQTIPGTATKQGDLISDSTLAAINTALNNSSQYQIINSYNMTTIYTSYGDVGIVAPSDSASAVAIEKVANDLSSLDDKLMQGATSYTAAVIRDMQGLLS